MEKNIGVNNMQEAMFWAISTLCLKVTSGLSGSRFRCSWFAAICAGAWVLLLYIFLINKALSSPPPFSYIFLLLSCVLLGSVPMLCASALNLQAFSMRSKHIFRCSAIYMGCMLVAGLLYILINFLVLLLLAWGNASGVFFMDPYRSF
jgi:hypothetical protein